MGTIFVSQCLLLVNCVVRTTLYALLLSCLPKCAPPYLPARPFAPLSACPSACLPACLQMIKLLRCLDGRILVHDPYESEEAKALGMCVCGEGGGRGGDLVHDPYDLRRPRHCLVLGSTGELRWREVAWSGVWVG